MKLISRALGFTGGMFLASAFCAIFDPQLAINLVFIGSATLWGFVVTHYKEFDEPEKKEPK